MQAPDFWKARGLLSTLLLPISCCYSIGGALRQSLTTPIKISVPVICVGNLTAGGNGKTPVTLSLADTLQKMGKSPHIISRGYGGKEKGPLRIKASEHSAEDVGDEPLMMSHQFPTWVSRNRVSGAKEAIKAGADILLLDDGFQNPRLHKDLSIIVVDNSIGFSNGRVIPAGPMRETINSGLHRADAIALVKQIDVSPNPELAELGKGIPLLSLSISPKDDSLEGSIAGKSIFAFAAIGYPEKFYTTLKNLGGKLVGHRDFPDHHQYNESDLKSIIHEAKETGAELILTTEKDSVKIPEGFKKKISFLPIRAVWDNPKALDKLLTRVTGSS